MSRTASWCGKPRRRIIRPAVKNTPTMNRVGVRAALPYSWYTYSPVRLKYPLIRSSLLDMWREAMGRTEDPVAAWESIVDNEEKRRRFHRDRGKGGFVRATWDQAATIVAAGLIHTIKRYGPDRIFGFSPIPAMSMVCYRHRVHGSCRSSALSMISFLRLVLRPAAGLTTNLG